MKLYLVLNLWMATAVPGLGADQNRADSTLSRRSMQAGAMCGPCQNGGECLGNKSSARVCTCLAGYTGIHCEVDIHTCEHAIQNAKGLTDVVAVRAKLSTAPVEIVGQRAVIDERGRYSQICKAFIELGPEYTGLSDGIGGAIYVGSGDVSISGSIFSNNEAGGEPSDRAGGAIYVESGNVSISGSVFSNNQAVSTGGAIGVYSGEVSISRSEFSYNHAGSDDGGGGAIYVFSGDVSISGSTFSKNEAGYGGNSSLEGPNGGAIYVTSGNVSISVCIFSNNKAYRGGAIYLTSGYVRISASTFSNNEGGLHRHSPGVHYYARYGYGGAIYVSSATVSISGSIFSKNQAGNLGDHVYASVRVLIFNSAFSPILDGPTSVYLERESGCEEYLCNSSHSSSCSYSNFSLSCAPCLENSYSFDRLCIACSRGKRASRDQRSCTDDAIDCAGEWSACSVACRREWTQTAAPRGTGAACSAEPRCVAGEDKCQSRALIAIELAFILSILILCCARYNEVCCFSKHERAFKQVGDSDDTLALEAIKRANAPDRSSRGYKWVALSTVKPGPDAHCNKP